MSFCRWGDSICKRSQRLHPKTHRPEIHFLAHFKLPKIADLHFVVICYSNNTTQAQTLPSKDFSCVDLSSECRTSLVTDDLNSSILMLSKLSLISVFLILVSVAMLIASASAWKRQIEELKQSFGSFIHCFQWSMDPSCSLCVLYWLL